MTGPGSVGVIGAGTLGATVARGALAAGGPVTVLVRPGTEDRHRAAFARALVREVRRGQLAADTASESTRRLHVTADPSALGAVDAVVECVPESVDRKRAVLAAVEPALDPETVWASSTSSIPAADLARDARHPERVVVAHHVWPAHRVRIVEVAFHDATVVGAQRRLQELLAAQGRVVVTVADRPGFLFTRALYAYWDAAVGLVTDGRHPAAVDAALERAGWALGPLRLMDATTLTTVVRVLRALAPHLDAPLPALQTLAAAVDAGATSFFRDPTTLSADPTTLARLVPRGTVAHCVDDVEVVTRTVGAMAREVGTAVLTGAAPAGADAAVEQAFGFPCGRGGLAAFRPALVPSPTG